MEAIACSFIENVKSGAPIVQSYNEKVKGGAPIVYSGPSLSMVEWTMGLRPYFLKEGLDDGHSVLNSCIP